MINLLLRLATIYYHLSISDSCNVLQSNFWKEKGKKWSANLLSPHKELDFSSTCCEPWEFLTQALISTWGRLWSPSKLIIDLEYGFLCMYIWMNVFFIGDKLIFLGRPFQKKLKQKDSALNMCLVFFFGYIASLWMFRLFLPLVIDCNNHKWSSYHM